MGERSANGSEVAAAEADSPATAGLRVKHLPPLCLRLQFPRGYPSTEPPDFTLAALWLSTEDAASLAAQLKRLWEEQVNLWQHLPSWTLTGVSMTSRVCTALSNLV